jgi:hypothetical protein
MSFTVAVCLLYGNAATVGKQEFNWLVRWFCLSFAGISQTREWRKTLCRHGVASCSGMQTGELFGQLTIDYGYKTR